MTSKEWMDRNGMPSAMDDEFPQLDWVLRWLWTGMAWLGFFSMVAMIGFVWGYWA